jgi:hypothetical protein
MSPACGYGMLQKQPLAGIRFVIYLEPIYKMELSCICRYSTLPEAAMIFSSPINMKISG